MIVSIGIVLALVALLAWGIGDFLIQRAARLGGSVGTMFFIGLAFSLAAYPAASAEGFGFGTDGLFLLVATAVIITLASVFDFEALRQGKMAIAEPVIGLETPLTVLLAVAFAGERLSVLEVALIALIVLGTMLVVTKRLSLLSYHRRAFERGVSMAVLAAFGLAVSNFFVGESSRLASPLLVIWWIGAVHLFLCAGYLIWRGQVAKLAQAFLKHPATFIALSVADLIAWIAFATAAVYAPISIVAAVSSGYIALAVLLGIFISREKVRTHQALGIALAAAGIAALSAIAG